ncbi:sensor histidine kinase [Chloroflexota bacterium]
MEQYTVLTEDEPKRKADAIKLLSRGFTIVASIGVIAWLILSLFNNAFPLIPVLSLTVSVIIISFIAYRMAKAGNVKNGSYFFIITLIVILTIATYLYGGANGPLAVALIIPILIASMLIGLRSSFLVATIASIFILLVLWIEIAGLFPQVIEGEWEEIAAGSTKETFLGYMTIITHVLVYYLAAFLSWFATSQLNRALHGIRRYAVELQAANEKLQSSEEELRASNEELEASNEELRATEEELRAGNEEMEAVNEELREAQEHLVRSEKLAAIGQLAGGVGHELRNPLGAIKNAVYYIRGKLDNNGLAKQEPRVMEFLDIVDDEINSSSKIISDLLNFSRVGKPAVSPARVEKVIEDAIAHTVVPENVELLKNLPAGLPVVAMDTDQIRQVFVNIINNAVQAMPEGGKLTISAGTEDSSLKLEVADNGIGIPDDAIQKIFDPLYTMKAKGIGLGLAVSKSIIERHEGSISVKSKVGEGTTFIIMLPLKAE